MLSESSFIGLNLAKSLGVCLHERAGGSGILLLWDVLLSRWRRYSCGVCLSYGDHGLLLRLLYLCHTIRICLFASTFLGLSLLLLLLLFLFFLLLFGILGFLLLFHILIFHRLLPRLSSCFLTAILSRTSTALLDARILVRIWLFVPIIVLVLEVVLILDFIQAARDHDLHPILA